MSNTNPRSGATTLQRPNLIRRYLERHLQVFVATLGQLLHQPLNTLLTTLVIGIALALPTGLHLLISNLDQVVDGWKGSTRISLFLQLQTPEAEAQALATRLRARNDISQLDYISPQQSLDEFQQRSGIRDLIGLLQENPLPAVLVLQPNEKLTPEAMQQLLEQLQAQPEVELAQLDMAWVKRLHALMAIGERTVLLLSALLALAVLVVVGNTIRLCIQNRREEIVVTKLIGATNAFIRRPFLYLGGWYGLLGGLLAWALVSLALALLAGPVANLAELYHSNFVLHNILISEALVVILFSGLLGLLGAWVAVSRHLHDIEPS